MAIRPYAGSHEHLAAGTKTVIYLTGKTFGVIETEEEISKRMACREQKQ